MSTTEKKTAIQTTAEVAQAGALESWKDNDLFAEGFSTEFTTSLKEGQAIRGVFLGAGGGVETEDENTGEVRTLRTWRIKNGPAICNLIGSAQLNTRFLGLQPGIEVAIRHEGQVKGRGARRVNNYSFMTKGGDKLPPRNVPTVNVEAQA